MKNMNRYGLGLALGLGLLLANAGFAQTITQPDQKKATESCCAIACCSHDSASMKDAKEHSSKHEGCCGSDSCNMKMKNDARNHAADSNLAGCCGCCGDSCDTKMKDGATNHATKAACCGCCGDSCDMKMKDGSKHMNHSDMAGCCGCCGDWCAKNMQDTKHKEKAN
jgi:hypothetical protein